MSQFNLFSLQLRHFALAFLVTFILGCAGGPGKTSAPKKEQAQETTQLNAEQQPPQQQPVSAQQYLQQAQTANSQQATELLVRASEQYLYQQQYYQALWLATQNSAIIAVSSQLKTLSATQQYRLTLVKIHALVALNDFSRAAIQLQQVEQLAQDHSISKTLRYYQLKAQVSAFQQKNMATLEAQLQAFHLNSKADEDDIWQIWQGLVQLPSWQVKKLTTSKAPHAKGWLQLLSYTEKFGTTPMQRSHYLQQWQREYRQHPGQVIIDDILTNMSESTTQFDNIAVLLPLSGKQQAAGLSAQQGILLAYQNEANKELHFIDTNKLDMTGLYTQFQTLKIDAVIGPLLKTNVEKYRQQTDITLPVLLLNVPEQPLTEDHVTAFSMRPEDEAIQAATMLSSKQYQHPLLLTQKDATSQRIAKTFTSQWQKLTGHKPEVLTFERGAQMQNEIKASLEVDRSMSRISELKRYLKQTFKYQERNRRDIDMIYLVGTPEGIRLLKPYIDVNISPFAKLIPVYASSRSHSASEDSSIYNDLYGLSFTEMPWLLPSTQQNALLAQQANKLWPQQSVTQKRIFAMGYDSYALINKLSTMKHSAYLRHFGQTGVLQLNETNILTRSLLWGKYQRNKVQEIAFD